MPPTGHDLHIDVPLSNIVVAYRPYGMVADQIAPMVPVDKQSNSYPIWSQADYWRGEDDKRAPGTEAKKIERGVSSDTYNCLNYALKESLTLEDRENMDDAYKSELRAGKAKYIKDKLVLNWEIRVASQLTNTANVGSSSAVTSDWQDYATGNSDPLGDMWAAIHNVQDATGFYPNRCLMSEVPWRHFRRHADVVDIIHGNSGAPKSSRYATRENFKAIFDLETFIVAGAYKNAAEEGLDASISQIWGDYVLVYFAPPNPSKEMPSFMYSFRWRKGSIPNMTVEVHPFDRKIKAEEVEVGYYQAEKIVSKPLGFLITNPTSV